MLSFFRALGRSWQVRRFLSLRLQVWNFRQVARELQGYSFSWGLSLALGTEYQAHN